MPTPPRFSIDEETGIITDAKTGNKWIVGPDSDTTYYEALDFASGITEDSGGWRIPTVKELREIFESGKGTRNIDPLFNTTGKVFWAEEKATFDARVFICCAKSEDWRKKVYSINARAFAIKP